VRRIFTQQDMTGLNKTKAYFFTQKQSQTIKFTKESLILRCLQKV